MHYCVTNIPGAVSRTSSHALCNATLPYVRELAAMRLDVFEAESEGNAAAINIRDKEITNDVVVRVFENVPTL